KLIYFFSQLPGVGPRTAERYVFSLLNNKQDDLLQFAQALVELKEQVKNCSICNCITESDPCLICTGKNRDRNQLCIVSDSRDMLTIEATGRYPGLYFNLGGTINMIDGVNPETLASQQLLIYLKHNQNFKEVILAFDPTIEGETTAMYLAKLIKPVNLKITRLARGLPMGASLEYADEMTLNNAFKYRMEVN
ncbi:MAG: recombination mediator RecR, partial [Candidatus Falkowbacteria bacterium]|nr:recombination mediator RecR [Candidatus Falkowbacteria bacterium]